MNSITRETSALGPVVAGTDGSEKAMEEVLWAAGEAAARKQPLAVVHAIGVEQAGYVAHDESHRVLDTAKEVLDDAATLVSRW
ncbi:hypothetical protein ACIOEX_11770 [Streptomyces sp. NPDC087850]|uniref:hypothetical protein n=1 Tax=Streptomyces sp. NPDC087850 TaxID=3365809 RepID=UPI00380E165A